MKIDAFVFVVCFFYILHWLVLRALCARYKPIIKNNYTGVCGLQSVTTGCNVLLHKSITVMRIRSLHSHKGRHKVTTYDFHLSLKKTVETGKMMQKKNKTWQPVMLQYGEDVERVTKYTRERASHCRGKCGMDCLWSKVVCSLTSCSTLTQCLQVLTDDGSSLVGRLIDPACIPDTDVALLNGAVLEMHLATLPLEHHQRWAAKVKGYKEPFDFYGLAPIITDYRQNREDASREDRVSWSSSLC